MEVELLYTAEHEGRGLLHTVELGGRIIAHNISWSQGYCTQLNMEVGLSYTVEHSGRIIVLYSLEQGGGVIIHR